MEQASTKSQFVFENVTLLITHYNRSGSLERLLTRMKELEMKFAEIVVSDDASSSEHLQKLKELQNVFHFKLITTPFNRNLANNINKGQDATHTPYVLYIQEDFLPTSLFPQKFADSLRLMEKYPEIDMAKYYAYRVYPYLEPLSDEFSRIKFDINKPGYRKFYVYSDHCHLRRSNFFERFGRYDERIMESDKAEYLMMMSFIRNKGQAIVYDYIKDNDKELFEHLNSDEEPSTITRDYFANTNNKIISEIRDIYRKIKFNLDYRFLLSKYQFNNKTKEDYHKMKSN
jgi:glycosyltransferase involved in cell wall biosynthesis